MKLVKGNPGRRPLNKKEPQPTPGTTAPSHLDDYAREEWDRVAAELTVLGLLSKIDRAALGSYCQSYSRWRKAEEQLQKSGLLIKTTNGNVVQNPLVGVANRAMELMHKFMGEFGMTPSSRSRIEAGPGENEKDPAEKYFSPGGSGQPVRPGRS